MTLKQTYGTPIVDALHEVVAFRATRQKPPLLSAIERNEAPVDKTVVVTATVNVYVDEAHRAAFDPVSSFNTGDIYGLDLRGDLIAQIESHLKAGALSGAADVVGP